MNSESIVKVEFQQGRRVNAKGRRQPKYTFREWYLGKVYIRAIEWNYYDDGGSDCPFVVDQVREYLERIEQPDGPVGWPEVPDGILPVNQLVFHPVYRRWTVEWPWADKPYELYFGVHLGQRLSHENAAAVEEYARTAAGRAACREMGGSETRQRLKESVFFEPMTV